MRLTKHHGLGNDFLVSSDPLRPPDPALARAVCDRHRGVGADGLLHLGGPTADAQISMVLLNADGSRAEMSGNGIGCLVQAAALAGRVTTPSVVVATDAGLRHVEVRAGKTPGTHLMTVSMGDASVGGDEPEWSSTDILRAARVDVGNPHLVLHAADADRLSDRRWVEALGEHANAAIPGGINVELIAAGDRSGELRMDVYERGILAGAAFAAAGFGWHWKGVQALLAAITAGALAAIAVYGGELARADQAFALKYFLSSQTAIMWMSVLFALATLAYWGALLRRSGAAGSIATGLTWSAAAMGLIGLLVRWYESYLIGPDVGHIPVSNLYEVFVLFCIITALLHLYYEARYGARQMGAFVLPLILAAVGFLLWYTFDRGAHEIQPLVPALQSWWMKIHVPANFIGYGAFAMAAMISVAYLVGAKGGRMAGMLPALVVMDDLMHKAIAIGFVFFTIATILGAMWAADAWGGYWSWDPKETWALIVWLNYAAWLHMRLIKGLRGAMLAWWAVVGLFVTLFAFLGVNMFLSGLHSYGEL